MDHEIERNEIEISKKNKRIEELEEEVKSSGGFICAELLLAPFLLFCGAYAGEKATINKAEQYMSRQCEELSATIDKINDVEYLSVSVNGQKVKLFYYNGKYETANTIKKYEIEKATKQVESNLVEKIKLLETRVRE